MMRTWRMSDVVASFIRRRVKYKRLITITHRYVHSRSTPAIEKNINRKERKIAGSKKTQEDAALTTVLKSFLKLCSPGLKTRHR